MREIPLKVVLDDIAAPPGTTTIPFGGGTGYLPNGNQFQIAAGSITFAIDTSSLVIPAARMKELADQVQALTDQIRAGVLDTMSFKMAVENGALPAEPARKDKTDSLTGVNQ